MDQNQYPQKDMKEKLSEGFNFVVLSGQILSKYAMVFLRRNIGPEGIGINGMFAAFLLFLLAGLSANVELWLFFFAWFFFVGLQKLRTLYLLRRGWMPHSRYPGDPYLAMLFCKNERVALFIEPILVLLIAAGLTAWSDAVATLFAASGIALFGNFMAEEQRIRVEIQRMHDAQLEQAQVMNRFHGGGGQNGRR